MINTFADLVNAPSSLKIALAEITAGEQIPQVGWTLYSGNAYSYPVSAENITLPSGKVFNYTQDVSNVSVAGVNYSVASSPANCAATSSSWFYDGTSTLYVNFNGNNPNTALSLSPVMMQLPLRFSTNPASMAVSAGTRFYDPFIESIPVINQTTSQTTGGYSTTSISRITLSNEDGLFDQLASMYVWQNQAVKILFGGESLPYSEYVTVFGGRITDISWNRKTMTLALQSNQQVLQQMSVPKTQFSSAGYPNSDPSLVGKFSPLAYGVFAPSGTDVPARSAVYPLATDEATYIGSDTALYAGSWADNQNGPGVYAISNVRISYDNGTSWTTATPDSGGPFNSGNYMSVSAANKYRWCAPNLLAVRFNAAGYAPASGKRPKVAVELSGKCAAGGTLLVSISDIIQDLLINYAGFTSNDIDTASFASAKAASVASVTMFVDAQTPITTVIDKLCQSDFGYFYVNNAGKFAYKVWVGNAVATVALDETSIIRDSLDVGFYVNQQFTKINVGYNANISKGGDFLYSTASDALPSAVYGNNAFKTVTTFLTGQTDATNLAVRQLVLQKYPLSAVRGKCKWQLGNANIGDVISITTTRSPGAGGSYITTPVELVSLTRNMTDGTTEFVGRSIPQHLGYWTNDSAPGYATATPAQRLVSGFWTDDSGNAVAGDLSTNGTSVYF